MSTRPVGGDVRFLDASAAEGDPVRFRLERVGFAEDAVYMPSDVDTVVLADGTIDEVELWASEEGGRNLLCILPNGFTFAFSLQPGADMITISELYALNSPLEPEISPTIQNLIDEAVAEAIAPIDIDFVNERARYANASNTTLGAGLIGYRGRSLNQTLDERVSLSRFGFLPDGSVSLETALAAAFAAPVPAGTVLEVPPMDAGVVVDWAGTTTWPIDDITIDFRNQTVLLTDAPGKIRASAHRGQLRNALFMYVPAAGGQGTGLLFANKDLEVPGTVAHNCWGWRFYDCIFHNVATRLQRLGRYNVRVPYFTTTLAEAFDNTDDVLTVTDVTLLGAAQYVAVLLNNFSREVKSVDLIDVGNNTVEIASPFSDGAPSGRRVSSVTLTTVELTAGMDTVTVGSTAQILEGEYTYIRRPNNTIHVAEITDVVSATQFTIDPVFTGVTTPAGAVVNCVNDGEFPSGTDFSHDIQFHRCTWRHARVNHPVELGGITDGVVDNCDFHDLVRYIDPGDLRYGTEVSLRDLVPEVDYSPGQGEGVKVTAGSYRCVVRNSRFRRIARNPLDFFAGGGGLIKGNSFWDCARAAIELKFSLQDVVPPNPVTIIENHFENISTFPVLAGVPRVNVSNNTFRNTGGMVYLNGASSASVSEGGDDDVEELFGYSEGIVVSGNTGYIEDTVIADADNRFTGIQVTEVGGAVIMGNNLSGFFYNITLLAGSTRCVVANNVCRNHVVDGASEGQDIRIVGSASVESRHTIANNTLELPVQFFNDEARVGTTVNNVGTVAAGIGATPDASKWPEGALVVNTSDTPDTVWLRYGSASILRIA